MLSVLDQWVLHVCGGDRYKFLHLSEYVCVVCVNGKGVLLTYLLESSQTLRSLAPCTE